MSMPYKKQLISRILSEANDIKRTPDALAKEIGIPQDQMARIMSSDDTSLEEIYAVIEKMGECYPIDKSDLMLIQSDCDRQVKFMRQEESKASSRTFHRQDRSGELSPYYEYRDTVMSRLSPFKPEWIKELRVVNDSDAENPDVVYNNGHFMHQLTFFIGPVNFYWEVDGKKYCREMNTGDSNYITPYWRHSFAARSENELCLILAITFGSEVRRAQKEIYALGESVHNYVLDYRNPQRAVLQVIESQMKNENLSIDNFEQMVNRIEPSISVKSILSGKQELNESILDLFAKVLNIEPSDLHLPSYNPEEEVVVTHSYQTDGYAFPSNQNPKYVIKPLARTSKMPHMKGFDIDINTHEFMSLDFESNLHSYVYNYSDEMVEFYWENDGQTFQEQLKPGDSVYILPFVKHAFTNQNKKAKLFVARVSGAVNLSTQKELSYFSDISRAISEQKCWFKGK